MDQVQKGGTVTVSVGGIEWTMRRRCTAIMVKVHGIAKVLGLMNGMNSKKVQEALENITAEEIVEAQRSVLQVALVSPRIAAPGDGPVPPETYAWEDVAPYADALLIVFMASGLDADPTPRSCGGEIAQPS